MDHGWYLLPPFYLSEDKTTLIRVEKMHSGRLIVLEMKEGINQLQVCIDENKQLTNQEIDEVIQKVKWMYRLNEELDEFYKLCAKNNGWKHVVVHKKGRLLRSSDLFEDIVKTILTINTTWSRTVAMTQNFVYYLGERYANNSEFYSFPTPESVLEKSEEFLNATVKLGYRSQYIYEFAQDWVNEKYAYMDWLNPELSTEQVATELSKIRGVGPYALSNILMLLGRYDLLPIDSEFKKHVQAKYFSKEQPSKVQMQKIYEAWGKYKFLGYWFDE